MKMIIIMVVGDNVNEMNDSLDLKLCASLMHTKSPYDACAQWQKICFEFSLNQLIE